MRARVCIENGILACIVHGCGVWPAEKHVARALVTVGRDGRDER